MDFAINSNSLNFNNKNYTLRNNNSLSLTSLQTYDDIDYNNVEDYGTVKEDNNSIGFWESFYDNCVKPIGAEKTKGKVVTNTVFYSITQNIDTEAIAAYIGTSSDNPIVILFSVVLSGFAKGITSEDVGKGIISGLSKPMFKYNIESLGIKTLQNSIKSTHPSISQKVLEELTDTGAKVGKVKNNPLKPSGDAYANEVFKNQMTGSLMNMGIGFGVDYVASLGVNLVLALQDGDVTWEEIGLGSTMLKSAWKTVCATAFETMGTFAGPAGRKIGKLIGTVVGATIGDFLVDAFETEGWCAIAGAATIAGAAIGGIIATACVVGGAIAVSVPVAGWIVGGAIIVGAAVATAVTYLCKWLFG